jgi:hypothetical protein
MTTTKFAASLIFVLLCLAGLVALGWYSKFLNPQQVFILFNSLWLSTTVLGLVATAIYKLNQAVNEPDGTLSSGMTNRT